MPLATPTYRPSACVLLKTGNVNLLFKESISFE